MFKLEPAITEWRQAMLTAGIKAPVPLEELESHLRDDVEKQTHAGVTAQNAFENAVRSVGDVNTLKNEFKKVRTRERKLMKKIMIVGSGALSLLVGLGFVLPALAQYREMGSMTSASIGLLCLGLVLAMGGVVIAVRGVRRLGA